MRSRGRTASSRPPPKRIRQDVGRLEPPQRCRFASRAGLLYCLFKTALAAAPSFRPGALINDAIRADRFLDVRPPLFGQSTLGVGWTSRSRAQAPPRSPNRACSARPASYQPAVAVLDRSSVRTWLNSVLSLCAPHWGQRSADDQAPHRGHALCLRFGTTALPVHRCRISLPRTPQRSAPQASRLVPGQPNMAPTGAAETSSTNSIRLEAERVLPSPEFRVTSTRGGGRAASSAGTGRALATEIIVQIPAVRLHVAQSRDAHEHRLALGGGPWCHAPTAESPRPSCDRLASDPSAMDRRLSFRPTGQRARRGRKRNRQ